MAIQDGHVFISYVHEDLPYVNRLQNALGAAGIPVWRDTNELLPGDDWRAKIRSAITDEALIVIACFSSRSLDRTRSHQLEELSFAVDEVRKRNPDVPWLIPARFDECRIPDYNIGHGRLLSDLQRADLYGDKLEEQTTQLIRACRESLNRQRRRLETVDKVPRDRIVQTAPRIIAAQSANTRGRRLRDSWRPAERLRYGARRSKAFWGKNIRGGRALMLLASPHAKLLAGFDIYEESYPSSLASAVYSHAAFELATYFTRLNVDAEVSYLTSSQPDQQPRNIVVLGAEALGSDPRDRIRLPPSAFSYDKTLLISLYDHVRDIKYVPEFRDGRCVMDYGTVTRMRNPFALQHSLIMIGSTCGFGTWGGVRLLSDKRFLRICASFEGSQTEDSSGIECLYATYVYNGVPELTRPLDIREINDPRIGK